MNDKLPIISSFELQICCSINSFADVNTHHDTNEKFAVFVFDSFLLKQNLYFDSQKL